MGENKIFLGSKILEVKAFQALSPVRLSVTDDELDDEGDNDFFLYLFHQSALGRCHRGRVHVISYVKETSSFCQAQNFKASFLCTARFTISSLLL